MPSKSKAQHRFMAAAAHNPAFAKKAGISQEQAAEFVHADKGIVSTLVERKKKRGKKG